MLTEKQSNEEEETFIQGSQASSDFSNTSPMRKRDENDYLSFIFLTDNKK